jgi:Na+-transporting NADH:ubiquinone oxidoreductase subunit NqrB
MRAGVHVYAWLKRLRADPRHAQIVSLVLLLAIQFAAIDFGATPLGAACAVGGALATQAWLGRGGPMDLRSPLISGLSLALLLRAAHPFWLALAGGIAIASKYALRFDGRPVFNPSACAIVALLAAGAPVWVSPGQWGAELWFAALIVCLAGLVLPTARRADVALYFLGAHLALLLARAAWLGDPLRIPLHQIESGSLLVFAAFMITDPKTTPRTSRGRLVFAVLVAALAHGLAFHAQVRPALYFALIALNPLAFVIDRTLARTQEMRRRVLKWRLA